MIRFDGRVRMKRVSTGIGSIDEQLGGGFPEASSVLLLSQTPSEKRMFAEQFIVTGVQNDETCLYVDFYRSPSFARSHFRRYGITGKDKLAIVDAVSSQIMAPSEEKYVIRDVLEMDDIRGVIENAFEDEGPMRVILDSLDFLVDRFPREEVLDFWHFMKTLSRDNNSVFLTLFINWVMERRELNALQKSADYLLEFRTGRMGRVLMNLMKIHKNQELGIDESGWIPFAFENEAGVVTYSPRIMVTGSANSGKTEFIRLLCPRSVVDDDGMMGEGVDRGKIDVSNVETEVFGVPGDNTFESTFRLFSREVSGIFLILDSTEPKDLEKGREIVASNLDEVPLVVVANKQDLEGALSAEEIRKKMDLPDAIPIIETSLSQDQDVSPALQSMLQLIGAG